VIDENALNIFTDGSCYERPRRGGVGILFVWIDSAGIEQAEPLEQWGTAQGTIGRMELLAPTLALQGANPYLQKRRFSRILVHSDSQYLVRFWSVAVNVWSKNKWRKKGGAPVENADQWQDLIRATQKVRMRVDFVWVEGHAKDPYNKQADRLARQSAQHPYRDAPTVATVRRKKSPLKTDPKSVAMRGQRIAIRIVASEWMRVQRTNKYRYEVVSMSSPFHGAVSFLYSDFLMKPGHTYSVRLNSDDGNPSLLKLFKEIPLR
jgi:ribonuclease HI